LAQGVLAHQLQMQVVLVGLVLYLILLQQLEVVEAQIALVLPHQAVLVVAVAVQQAKRVLLQVHQDKALLAVLVH
jgi:hypothetical protein